MNAPADVMKPDDRSFDSRDFWRVSRSIISKLPDTLHHPGVCTSQNAGAKHFSDERKHPVYLVDLPTKSISMTIGIIQPGQHTNRHRHNYESVIYVVKGEGTTFIEDHEIIWKAGDAIYIPVWAWHHHKNNSTNVSCQYVACENAPLLQNLGGIAVREETDEL